MFRGTYWCDTRERFRFQKWFGLAEPPLAEVDLAGGEGGSESALTGAGAFGGSFKFRLAFGTC